jgi:hypothetical protein
MMADSQSEVVEIKARRMGMLLQVDEFWMIKPSRYDENQTGGVRSDFCPTLT